MYIVNCFLTETAQPAICLKFKTKDGAKMAAHKARLSSAAFEIEDDYGQVWYAENPVPHVQIINLTLEIQAQHAIANAQQAPGTAAGLLMPSRGRA